MSLSINERRNGAVVVLDLVGKIRLGGDNINLHRVLQRLVREGEKSVLINLEEVRSIDSSGLGELIAGYASLERSGGELKLLKLTARVSELMAIAKLLTVFDVYETEAEAVRNFSTVPAAVTQPLDGSRIQKAKATSIF